MVDSKFVKRQIGLLAGAYGFFCTAVVSLLFCIENGLVNLKEPGALTDAGFFSAMTGVRIAVLFLSGLPFIALLSRRQIEQEKLVRLDDITGLCNHRQLLKALDRELARSKRYRQPLSVLMIDIDGFKNINDRYGHLAGDQILQEMGPLFSRGIREVDIAGRYGGDEFLMILPHTKYEEAQRLAWRLWSNVRRHAFKFEGELVPVSLSVGISSLQDLGEDADGFDLIRGADQAMFNAKNAKHLAREKMMAA